MNRSLINWACMCGLLACCAAPLGAQPRDAELLRKQGIDVRRVQSSQPKQISARYDLVYARYGDREMRLDLFLPEPAAGRHPAVVVVHGGGWLKGDKTRFRALAEQLAVRGYVAAAIEYRLGGEAPFPAAVHDCHAAVRWLRAVADQYSIDPQRIAAVGGSAGGHLVALLAAAPDHPELKGEGGNAEQSSALQAAIVMAGPMELASGPLADRSRTSRDANINRWLGKTVDQAPELYRLASPHEHLSGSTPPMLFLVGEHDQPQRNRASRQKLRELGVRCEVQVYPHGDHGCWNLHPWFGLMLDDIDTFLTSALSRSDVPPRHMDLAGYPVSLWQTEGIYEIRFTDVPQGQSLKIPRLNNTLVTATGGGLQPYPLTVRPGTTSWEIEPGTNAWPESVVLRTKTPLYLPLLPRILSAAADGSVMLPARHAVTHGEMLRFEPQPHKNTIGYWVNAEDWCEWLFFVDQPGRYEVEIWQGCAEGQGGSEVAVRVGQQDLRFRVEETGGFQDFRQRSVGEIDLEAPGVYRLELRPLTKAAKAVMDVRQVKLSPRTPSP